MLENAEELQLFAPMRLLQHFSIYQNPLCSLPYLMRYLQYSLPKTVKAVYVENNKDVSDTIRKQRVNESPFRSPLPEKHISQKFGSLDS